MRYSNENSNPSCQIDGFGGAVKDMSLGWGDISDMCYILIRKIQIVPLFVPLFTPITEK